ncbi:hypothetical protein PFICI_11697 [Pestalotiopsis fici W106-1]|uniref:Zn(2)-C6 fungal-type domain-containing protein n=1 Tax=Pestalotiopsis fici (strain W106-1 / CGMCC3.15140) TaxID=1229662 RepID=W3WR20_PESFW|nr:uncharacterized protein PFICI_11697 [Pestalotiopsis fici W106-1]ETS76310.1 hypothetical protein PFICI_11697 [Pestalotiopsis fici W106-1]
MKRAKTFTPSDAAPDKSASPSSASSSAATTATTTTSTSTTSIPTTAAAATVTKRRRNNPDECYKVARITPNGTVTEAGTLRKRAQRACQQCHAHKTKCSGDLPKCARCQLNELPCEYTPSKRKFANLPGQSSASATPAPQVVRAASSEGGSIKEALNDQASAALDNALIPSLSVQDQLLRRDVILKHVDVYFEQLFHMPCMGFLHPGTIYRLIEQDKLPPPLAAGICSITADFVSPGAAGRAFALQCNEQLEFFVLRNCAFMTRDYLVYHLLAVLYNWVSGPLAKVWMWTATASRLIKCLQLNYEPDLRSSQETYAEREIQRRSVWQIYIIDHFLSGGHDEHLLLPSSSIHIRLPCSDQVFRDEQPSTMDTLDKIPPVPASLGDNSLDACHVRLLTIRSQVLRATKRFTDSPHGHFLDIMRPEQFMEHVNQFQTALYRFSDSLPEHLKLSVANVDSHILRPDRPSYTMLHTWYCQTHIELYSFSLHALKKSTPQDSIPWDFFLRSNQDFLFRSQQQAVSYAICLSQTWEYSLQNIKRNPSATLKSGLVTVDWMVGACAVDVVEVLLTARRYKLYENLRGNTSAQMCYSKPVDDSLLAGLISKIVMLVNDLAMFLPRVEHYGNVIQEKIKEFEEDMNSGNHPGSVKAEDHGPTPSPTNLPGMDNMIPQTQVGVNVSPKSLSDSASISEKYLRKKSTSFERPMGYNGVSQIADLPVMPYCLRQAQDTSLDGPFAPPTTGNFNSIHFMDHSAQPSFSPAIAPNMGPVFEAAFRSALPVDATMHGPMHGTMTYNHCPVTEGPQSDMQTAMAPYHTDENIFVTQGTPYAFPNEQQHHSPWVQHPIRDPHSYT